MKEKMIMEMYNIVNQLMYLLNQLIHDEINYIEEDYIHIINIQDDIYHEKEYIDQNSKKLIIENQ